jgi:hypothetical protein
MKIILLMFVILLKCVVLVVDWESQFVSACGYRSAMVMVNWRCLGYEITAARREKNMRRKARQEKETYG